MQYVTLSDMLTFALVILTAIGTTATFMFAMFNYINDNKKK